MFVRHACQKLNCQLTQSINMMMQQGYNPVLPSGNHHQISMTFHLLLLHHQSTIQSRQVPSFFFKKFAFPVQIRRQSIPVTKHQTDYPVSISFVTEIHVSMHILDNLLVVPVVVTHQTVCTSQHFTCLEHPNILQQTNKHLVQHQPPVIPTHWT